MQKVKYKNPIQFDSIHLALHKVLGECEETYSLAAHICNEPTTTPLPQVIMNLLERNTHIHALLTAIAACEKRRLQYTFDSTKRLSMDAQFSAAKKVIQQFNHIQDTLLDTIQGYLESLNQREAQHITTIHDTGNRSMLSSGNHEEGYHNTIAKSLDHWKKSGEIAIRNYHQGLTIRASATFMHEKDGILAIRLTEDVARIFAIHPSKKDVFAVCEGEKVQVRLTMKNIVSGVITLALGKTFPIYSEDRKHLNIQVQESIPVIISMGRRRQLNAQLHDLSIGGIGIQIQGINQAPYNIGDKVDCQLKLDHKDITLQGIVRWTGSSDEEARIGIELNPSKHTALLQKEVFRMQRSIISTIKQLELPDELKKHLT